MSDVVQNIKGFSHHGRMRASLSKSSVLKGEHLIAFGESEARRGLIAYYWRGKARSKSMWKIIRRLWPQFSTNISFKVGNGVKTQFWNEHWIGEDCLKATFPDLYNLNLLKSYRVQIWSDGVHSIELDSAQATLEMLNNSETIGRRDIEEDWWKLTPAYIWWTVWKEHEETKQKPNVKMALEVYDRREYAMEREWVKAPHWLGNGLVISLYGLGQFSPLELAFEVELGPGAISSRGMRALHLRAGGFYINSNYLVRNGHGASTSKSKVGDRPPNMDVFQQRQNNIGQLSHVNGTALAIVDTNTSKG
ncbi:hypothetical protein MTR67_002551 [Solanum verrucosum]|uniref:Uncharacterized protein n=1 Tax=Solanum verrucosum TaxID=315347 RepID=A0AAF0PR28_SOLVR|nr:hypothetical protein MTR67_002551 [Solanum verrucosum]